MEPFVNEYITICDTGITIGSTKVQLQISTVVCDAPARAFVKAVKQHGGYSACDKCEVIGLYKKRRMCYSKLDAQLRTDEKFIQATDSEHHNEGVVSPFTALNIGMISQFPLDYMHLVLLGVTRKMMILWTKGDTSKSLASTFRLPKQLVISMSKRLENFSHSCPSEFKRLPRGLNELNNFKATEFRSFLCYTCFVACHKIVDETVYSHLLLLACSLRILLSTEKCLNMS